MKKLNIKNRIAQFLLAMGMLVGHQITVYADQPAGVGWKIAEAATQGTALAGNTPGGDARFSVALFPWNREITQPLLVLFRDCGQDPEIDGKPVTNLEALLLGKDPSPLYNRDWKAPVARWRICPTADAFIVDGTSNTIATFEVDFLRLADEGMSPRLDFDVYQISAADLKMWPSAQELARHYRNKQPGARTPLSVHYRMARGVWSFGSYETIYGAAGKARATGDYLKFAAVLPVNVESFRRKQSIPTIKTFDRLASVKTAMESAILRGSGKDGEQICYPETPRLAANIQALAAISHSISGRFSTKWTTDHSLHSGFGFRVAAYAVSNNALLGTAWVETNGSWQIDVPTTVGFTGGQIRVNYLSYNSYYEPQNQANAKYWWTDPIWTVTSSSLDVGHRYADTDGGVYNGVGELVDNAMTMWSRLYWDAGINPVPATPIRFFFPNTWNNCGGTSPWSCASGNDLWLVAEHGVQGDVVNHEMGHVLNNKFWSNKRPAGSGGSHDLNTCYPTRLGMALREGFANYIAAWVGYPSRNVADGGFNSGRWNLGWDAEKRTSPPDCASGWTNEVWVARTFWDLHDTRADGDDILWFNHPGAVISLFLGNGIANDGDARDMRYYENIYRNAASAGHQGFISDIFDQNRM